MPLLLPKDYEQLTDRAISFEEFESQRFILFRDVPLNQDIYTTDRCDILVVIPPNYGQEGNDMFWTVPRLNRKNGAPIPQTNNPGDSDNRILNGIEYCRWSRHWPHNMPYRWRPGIDNINSIYRRVTAALENPDT